MTAQLSEKYAVRNLRLCTKDCLCLYVCPTGATDTENSIIDKQKCIGCGACAAACPSSAISMVPRTMPPQQKKEDAVIQSLRALSQSKMKQELISRNILNVFGLGLQRSLRLTAEDLNREAGFMLPQSGNTKAFLLSLKDYPDIPIDALNALLENLPFNETVEAPIEKWQCSVCGYVHEGPMTPDFTCPVCKQPAEKFVKLQ